MTSKQDLPIAVRAKEAKKQSEERARDSKVSVEAAIKLLHRVLTRSTAKDKELSDLKAKLAQSEIVEDLLQDLVESGVVSSTSLGALYCQMAEKIKELEKQNKALAREVKLLSIDNNSFRRANEAFSDETKKLSQ